MGAPADAAALGGEWAVGSRVAVVFPAGECGAKAAGIMGSVASGVGSALTTDAAPGGVGDDARIEEGSIGNPAPGGRRGGPAAADAGVGEADRRDTGSIGSPAMGGVARPPSPVD